MRISLFSLVLLLQTGCSVVAVADAAVSVGSAAVSVGASAVKVGASVVEAAQGNNECQK
jgi:hypothetical protein